jgi:hypothetical protein
MGPGEPLGTPIAPKDANTQDSDIIIIKLMH